MANIKGGVINSKAAASAPAKTASPLSVAIGSDAVKKRFEEMLGKRSSAFLSSVLTVVNSNNLLVNATPKSVLAAAATAASLDLSVSPSLGECYIVPYKGQAAFQLGYKGIIALAQRSGKMKSIVMTPVYEGEIRNWNRFTETYEYGDRISDNVVGYFARFETVNGFAKAAYWTAEDVKRHALTFNPMCKAKKQLVGVWAEHFDSMACKTVLSSIMRTYAPKSLEMQTALESDDKVITVNDDGSQEYVDIDADEIVAEETAEVPNVDTETGELFNQ